jgi:hypothetical protein
MKRLLSVTVLGLAAAAAMSSPAVLAQNCSNPPTGFGGSWWSAYAKWCTDCGGVPNASNMSCNPGSNWGRTGSQAASVVSSSVGNAAYQSGYQLGQGIGKLLFGDPQAQQRAILDNQRMMQSLDQLTRERVGLEDQMLQNAARRAQQIEDRNRQETLSTLSGIPRTNELGLKPSTDFFAMPGNPKGDQSSAVDSSVVDFRSLDPSKAVVDPKALQGPNQQKETGTRTMDCAQGKTTRDRLAAGLPVQLDAIKRTEAQIEAARKGVEEAKAESKAVLLKGAIEGVKEYAEEVLTSADALRGQIETLKGLDKSKRDMLIRTVNTIAFGGEDLYQSASAGYKSGPELQKKVDSLTRQIAAITMETGIAEKAGEALSEKLWGPLGKLGFNGAKLSIELSVALAGGMISKTDQQTAQRNLDTMRDQYNRAKDHISELDSDLKELCTGKLRAQQ